MKIRKSQLRRIIKEEMERKLLQEDASMATPMAMHLLNSITRSGGQRASAIALMKSVFTSLPGVAAMKDVESTIEQKQASHQQKGGSWISE